MQVYFWAVNIFNSRFDYLIESLNETFLTFNILKALSYYFYYYLIEIIRFDENAKLFTKGNKFFPPKFINCDILTFSFLIFNNISLQSNKYIQKVVILS